MGGGGGGREGSLCRGREFEERKILPLPCFPVSHRTHARAHSYAYTVSPLYRISISYTCLYITFFLCSFYCTGASRAGCRAGTIFHAKIFQVHSAQRHLRRLSSFLSPFRLECDPLPPLPLLKGGVVGGREGVSRNYLVNVGRKSFQSFVSLVESRERNESLLEYILSRYT